MTIKEMEARTGMTRANIRFYESRGLLSPERGENGYRDYSEKDLAVLQRIKLLRMLDLSLEEIQKLQTGEEVMDTVLSRHLEQLHQEEERAARCRELCARMKADKVQYSTLNVERYLQEVNRSAPETPSQPQWKTDVLPQVRAPFRRFFARGLDLGLYTTIWQLFLIFVLDWNLQNRSAGMELVDTAAGLVLMFLLEPIWLHVAACTPGKWILGLRVKADSGERLTLSQARSRVWKVLVWGMGLGLPVYNVVRLWKSYRACEDRETLEWEYDSTLTVRDEKRWREIAWLGAVGVLALSLVLAMSWNALPKNRGEITVAQFCENYNRYFRYYGFDGLRKLDAEGNWVEPYAPNIIVVEIEEVPLPELQFEEENGAMTGVSFSIVLEGEEAETRVPSFQTVREGLLYAFAAAQRETGLFAGEVHDILEKMEKEPFLSFEEQVSGVSVSCQISYSGYIPGYDALVPEEGKPCTFAMTFSIAK